MNSFQFNYYMTELINQLMGSETVNEFIEVIDSEIKNLGFKNFNLFILPLVESITELSSSPIVLSSVHQKYSSWYLNNHYYRNDEVLESVIEKRSPQLLSDFIKHNMVSRQSRNIYREMALMWNIEDGIYLSSECFNFLIILNLNYDKSTKKKLFFINSSLPVAHYLLQSFHVAIAKSHLFDYSEIVSPLLPKMTPKQIYCLKLSALGLSQSQIAPKMHISINTVKYYNREIMKIFNTNSMCFAVYKGVKLGLIT